MLIQHYLDYLANIQTAIFKFLDDDENSQHNFSHLIELLDNQRIRENPPEFRLFMHLLSKIANNRHRKTNFFNRIFQILDHFRTEITQTYSNYELFNLFKKSKQILLFFIKENMLIIDQQIYDKIKLIKYRNKFYLHYFYPEVKNFLDAQTLKKMKELKTIDEDNFEEKRNKGENESYVCELIRKDSLQKFVECLAIGNMTYDTKIKKSIFETNYFLANTETTLLEYAVSCGSIHISIYLLSKAKSFSNYFWFYLIHGNNAKILHLVESKNCFPTEKNFESCFIEAIKCHHVEIFKYLSNTYLKNNVEFQNRLILNIFHFYNFGLIEKEFVGQSYLHLMCFCDYYSLVKLAIETMDLDLNSKIIFKNNFFL